MAFTYLTKSNLFCPLCQENNDFFRVTTAARIIDVNRRTIYRYIEEGKVYIFKTPGGTMRVCGSCLIKREPEK